MILHLFVQVTEIVFKSCLLSYLRTPGQVLHDSAWQCWIVGLAKFEKLANAVASIPTS